MNLLLTEENDDIINKKYNKDEEKTKNNKIIKYFKGIWIYFKDYVLFLRGNAISVFKMMNYATYHWGFQMILLIGMTQSYGAINIMAEQLSPHLVNEGEIE